MKKRVIKKEVKDAFLQEKMLFQERVKNKFGSIVKMEDIYFCENLKRLEGYIRSNVTNKILKIVG